MEGHEESSKERPRRRLRSCIRRYRACDRVFHWVPTLFDCVYFLALLAVCARGRASVSQVGWPVLGGGRRRTPSGLLPLVRATNLRTPSGLDLCIFMMIVHAYLSLFLSVFVVLCRVYAFLLLPWN